MSTTLRSMGVTASEAQRLIESMRKGIPPAGYVRFFTVGRANEIRRLLHMFGRRNAEAILVQANYGTGKSHLLRLVREAALVDGYAVSYVELDAKSGVRFDRIDQVVGAICRGLELPDMGPIPGVQALLDSVRKEYGRPHKKQTDEVFWQQMKESLRWHRSSQLESAAMYVAVRAWLQGNEESRPVVVDWLSQPARERAQLAEIYDILVGAIRLYFRDWQDILPRSFDLRVNEYEQGWAVLRDIHSLCIAIGLQGFVVLFDEFEDVIYNLSGINRQLEAFDNLFRFYAANNFPGKSMFAVTPDFVQKCKSLLVKKQVFGYDDTLFDKLTTFKMSPLKVEELGALAMKILHTHCLAYGWKPHPKLKAEELLKIVRSASAAQVEDRSRHVVRAVVKALDDLFEASV